MDTTKELNYSAPVAKVYLVKPANIICTSPEEGGENQNYPYGGEA